MRLLTVALDTVTESSSQTHQSSSAFLPTVQCLTGIMEVDEAHRLYQHFQQVDAAAKQKQVPG